MPALMTWPGPTAADAQRVTDACERQAAEPTGRRRWAQRLWPLPALAVWMAAWALWLGAGRLGAAPLAGWLVAAGLGAAAAVGWPALSPWRRLIMGLGFPASAAGLGLAVGLPAWAWLLPLALLLAAYPLKAWRDAPLFPTPRAALQGLADVLPVPVGARVLDAGCGLGHGLAALRAQWPHAELHGIEWSWPLALAARWLGRGAHIRQGDMWQADWRGYGVVYLFQRPESMARAWAKAQAELAPGSWLVSLDFAVPDTPPQCRLQTPGGRALWLYQVSAVAAANAAATADNPRHQARQRRAA